MSSPISTIVHFVADNGRKIMKYSAVSMVMVPTGQLLLFLLLEVADMAPVWANVTAVVVLTMPNYLLNRYWVWQKNSKNSISREILPFWLMALLGLIVSTGAVWLVDRNGGGTFAVLAANFIAFGVVWVLKFFVLDRVLFRADRPATASPA